MQSIAATTTTTGLTVQAQLGTGSRPTGVKVSDEQIAALPLTRHRFHGDWNYTLHPSPARARADTRPATTAWGPDQLGLLADPELTGVPRQHLAGLAGELAPSQARQREQQRLMRRGAERRRARGAGPRPKLIPADRVLATVLYLRKSFTQALLAEFFAVDRKTITIAVQETRPLLDQHGYVVAPSTARFHAPADLLAFLAQADIAPPAEIKAAC